MHQDLVEDRERRRAVLRIRLAGVALGATLLLLAPRSDQTAAGAALLGYTAAVLAQRFVGDGRSAPAMLAIAIDVLYAAGLSLLLPISAGTWALYALAIGSAGVGFGAVGAAVATAGAILTYDAVIALRPDELRPSDLWPVQLLLAVGLLVAELVWTATRGEAARQRSRTFALVQRDLIAARSEDDLLQRIADHAVRSFAATGAWIELDGATPAVLHRRGQGSPDLTPAPPASLSWSLGDAPPTRLRCVFGDPAAEAAAEPVIRDLATDAAPLLAAARERAALRQAKGTLDHALAAVRALEGDRVTTAVHAEVLRAATAIAGTSALVRPADGTVIAGDLAAGDAIALVRDTAPPALVRERERGLTGAVVSAGAGVALVASGTTHELTSDDLHALQVLAEIAAAATERIAERDALIERGGHLDRQVAELGERLRERDDAVASAVHELRTPLTSVHAYAQLTSRNLQAVQQQVKQLDRLIGDLLGSPGGPRAGLDLQDVDLLQEARQAARRLALVSGREVGVSGAGDGPFTLRADRSRVEQVIENLLNNAAKFSPPDDALDVQVERADREVVIAVTDHGSGILAADLERIFERHYRGAAQRGSVAGEGIGLAIAREIVIAHGGRIWAESDGPGKGSTFFAAFPIVPSSGRDQPLESTDGRRSGAEAPRQA